MLPRWATCSATFPTKRLWLRWTRPGEHGTRFFDTAPIYGAGLSEIRLGKYLAQHDRDDYVLSTKVGRLVLDEIDTEERNSGMFKFGRPNRVIYDYTEKGALKSIEGSLNRLGVDRLGHQPRAARSSTLRPRPTAKLGNYCFTTLSKSRDR